MTGSTDRQPDWSGQSNALFTRYRAFKKSFPNPERQLLSRPWLSQCDSWNWTDRPTRLKRPLLTAQLQNYLCTSCNHIEFSIAMRSATGYHLGEEKHDCSAVSAWSTILLRPMLNYRRTSVRVTF